jgi:SAM-dependent methyltransferase
VAFEELMGTSARLLSQAQALAALTARLRLDELGEDGDPAVREQLDRVVDSLAVREHVEGLEPEERAIVVALARSYLRQAMELVDDPVRAGSWTSDDPALLQAQGAASAAVARLLAGIGLASEGARILDVGTGVAGLAIAFCTTFPGSTVVGLDPWEPALALARENVAAAGLEERVTLLPTPVEEFEDADGFDLVWLPSFFIPEAALDAALARIHTLLRPGGTLVVGLSYGAGEPSLESAVDDLFTVRSGGSVLTAGAAIERLRRARFADPRQVDRTWDAPLALVVAGRDRAA